MNDIVENTLKRKRDIYQSLADIEWPGFTEITQENESIAQDFDTCLRLWRKYKQHEIVEFP